MAVAKEDDNGEVAFNLFSDVAPILALFGEQFARQFMSESLFWLDHVLFAMVPLGIIAAVTGAIRTQGPRIAKAFIGRVRENDAQVEFELLSSTSHEVGEAFNGRGIVRVLGKPTIATFLVFPKQYEEFDRQIKSDPLGQGTDVLESCGIHSLETVVNGQAPLMSLEQYRSPTSKLIRSAVSRLAGLRVNHIFSRPSKTNQEASDLETAPGEATGKANADDQHENKDTVGQSDFRQQLGPPNLELNFAFDHANDHNGMKHAAELIVAFVFAILLQTGLLVLAILTVTYSPLRDRIGFDPEVYGLPCYLGGSVLLSLGVGMCSYVVERKTAEYAWVLSSDRGLNTTAESREAVDDYPSLVYVQKSQEVSDQRFDPYILLAGSKREVIASTRNSDISLAAMLEDADGKGPKEPASSDTGARQTTLEVTESDGAGTKSGTRDGEASQDREPFWKGMTVAAAVAASLGFTSQFMGLRGLTYPCSLAQIGAIIVMTLIRAVIRRHLGREPDHYSAVAQHELDHLATRIVFSDSRQRPGGIKDENGKPLESPFWKVKLPELKKPSSRPVQQTSQHDLSEDHNATAPPSPTSRPKGDNSNSSENPTVAQDGESSGKIGSDGSSVPLDEQLLRVRSRLGDLCKWQSKASDHAIALCKSIEAFMDTFFDYKEHHEEDPEKHELNEDFFAWSVKTEGKGGVASSVDFRVKRRVNDNPKARKWEIDTGKIDAALSLWIAAMELELKSKRGDKKNLKGENVSEPSSPVQPSDWRRKNEGEDIAKRQPFCHIIGRDDKDGVLRRNLAWWADYEFDSKSTTETGEEDAGRNTDVDDDVLAIGFDRDWFHTQGDNRQQCHQGDSDVTARELFIEKEDSVLNMLAQHLFCLFVWQLSAHLSRTCLKLSFKESSQEVEIEGRDKFDPNRLDETWMSPRLSHKKLTGLVRQIENYGLGSRQDILICLVPAFSCWDLLPSQAILRLMPPVAKDHRWTETSRQYSQLLETSLRKEEGKVEILCYAAIIYTMDFLYIAYQPYDEIVRPEYFLDSEIAKLVRKLNSNEFAHIVKTLEPVHNRQHRGTAFRSLFSQYAAAPKSSDLYESSNFDIHKNYPHRIFGLSKLHMRSGNPGNDWSELQRLLYDEDVGVDAQDIFGWTALHYLIANQSFRTYDTFAKRWLTALKVPDRLGRTPIHVAATLGDVDPLRSIFWSINDGEASAAIQARGIDEMTPLHLAATNADSLKYVMKRAKEVNALTNLQDIWRREPMHVAARHWQKMGGNVIAHMGDSAWFLPPDDLGRSPIHYFFTKATKDAKQVVDEAERLEILVRICHDNPNWQDQNGKGFLHCAVDANDETAVGILLSEKININLSDAGGRTAVALACEHDHYGIVKLLADNDQTDLDHAADGRGGSTPLHLAVWEGHENSMAVLLEHAPLRVNIKALDSLGRTPLDDAWATGNYSCAELLLRYDLVLEPGQRENFKQKLTSAGRPTSSLIAKMFEAIIDEDDDRQLERLIELSSQLRSRGLCEKLTTKLLEGATWKHLSRPYHLAAQAGSSELMQRSYQEGRDPDVVDEDGWSWEYSAIRHQQAWILESQTDDSHCTETPLAFYLDVLFLGLAEDLVQVQSCREAGHNQCHGIHGISVAKASDEASHVIIRSKHPALPLALHDYFYFEVKVNHDSGSRSLGIGFCRRRYWNVGMPGWHPGAWGYHGDDGKLFVERKRNNPILRRPGSEDAAYFGAGDVAGVYLNFNSGKAFCTLNGRKLDFGEAADEKFKQKKFHVGKIYPCVGFDVEESGVGLRFEVNFGQSLQHPFAYQGPEIDQQGNIEHMIWMTETRSTEGEGEGGY